MAFVIAHHVLQLSRRDLGRADYAHNTGTKPAG
jgi:hypothetical protein